MKLPGKIKIIETMTGSYWTDRISAQIAYAARLSHAAGDKHDGLIESAADFILSARDADGTLTNAAAQKAEEMLSPLSAEAKKIKVHMASHAHIDMNWKWGFHETATITIETYRTMLDMLREYKDFIFSSSQAATYKIIEDYFPEMLDEIREMVKEGRWEIAVSTWTEPDRNMPSGESMARHILYSKKYMNELFGIPPGDLKFDLEPDTFGHNLNTPEILIRGGVKYYFLSRGYNSEHIFNWRSPSGASILVFREPYSYNSSVQPKFFADLPMFCKAYDVDLYLKLYGVGNHGGGPTRRDIERIIDIQGWPVMPTLIFSSYHRFFTELEAHKDKFNYVDQELNFIFTGCYTSQTRIKMANRIAEARLYESEVLCSASNLLGGRDYGGMFRKAWEKTLFNHFHDIIPGTGVTETREHALGLFQETMAHVNANSAAALRFIAGKIDTSAAGAEYKDMPESVSEGAGVGYGTTDAAANYHFPRTERSSGNVRIFHLFNTTRYKHCGAAKISMWDLPFEGAEAVFVDADGNEIESKFLKTEGYYGHSAAIYALYAEVEPFSYKTYLLKKRDGGIRYRFGDMSKIRVYNSQEDNIVMENEFICAEFDRRTMKLISYVDKTSNRQLISTPSAFYKYITEDHRSSAWRIGVYMTQNDLNEENDVRLLDMDLGGVVKTASYEIRFLSSVLKVTVSLAKNSKTLEFISEIDWREQSGDGSYTPLFTFNVPFAYEAHTYKYDIPFGFIERPEANDDRPACSIAAAVPKNGGTALAVVNDTKYGYRCVNNSIALSLIHVSSKPDPHPETDDHHIRVGLTAVGDTDDLTLLETSSAFTHPLAYVTNKPHAGCLPFAGAQLLTVEGKAQISSLKTPEDAGLKNKGFIIARLYDAGGGGGAAALNFAMAVRSAVLVDINENPVEGAENGSVSVSGNTVKFKVPANQSVALLISLAGI